jgi:hypothetical protein
VFTSNNEYRECEIEYGCTSKNLAELSVCLSHISPDVFNHHVNGTKNDFSNWIRDVLGDGTLADDLSEITKPTEAAKMVSERIVWLRKKAG